MMSPEVPQAELREKTQQLLHGALRHVRAAALAVALVPLGAVAVSPAVAQTCGSAGNEPCPPCDFITSGGFVVTDSHEKATFGAHGGCKRGHFRGHVNYVDHDIGYHVHSTEITGYLDPSPPSTTRDLCGVATTNWGETVHFRVRLVDNGEPGRKDEFGIRLSNDYVVTTRRLGKGWRGKGWRGGGDVELHDPNPSTVGPDPAPDEATMCHGVAAPLAAPDKDDDDDDHERRLRADRHRQHR